MEFTDENKDETINNTNSNSELSQTEEATKSNETITDNSSDVAIEETPITSSESLPEDSPSTISNSTEDNAEINSAAESKDSPNENSNNEVIEEAKAEAKEEPSEEEKVEQKEEQNDNLEAQNNVAVEEENKEEVNNFEAATNQEALESQKNEYAKLTEEIGKEAETINDEANFKIIRKNLVEYKERVLSLFLLPKLDRDTLIDKIQDIYNVLSEKQDKIREEKNKEYEKNLEEIKPEFEAVIEEISKATNFKDARAKLIEIQSKVRNAKLRTFEKDNFLKVAQENFEILNKKQEAEREAYEMECSENYLNLKNRIELEIKNANSNENFREARQILINAQALIKGVKLKKHNRDQLYQSIREEFNKLNEAQDQNREEFEAKSKEDYQKIKPVVDKACQDAINPTDYNLSRNTLIDLQKEIKDLSLTRQMKDELFGQIREVFSKLNELQENDREGFGKEADQNFIKLEIKVNEAVANVEYSNDFKDIREGLIAVQDEIKILSLKKHQRNELFKRIRQAFEAFDDKRNKYNDRRKEEKKAKLNSILENLTQKIERTKSSLEDENANLETQKNRLEAANDADKQSIEDIVKAIELRINEKNELILATENRIKDISNELAN